MVLFTVRNAVTGEDMFPAKADALPPEGLVFHHEGERYVVVRVEAYGQPPSGLDSGPGAVLELFYVVYVEVT